MKDFFTELLNKAAEKYSSKPSSEVSKAELAKHSAEINYIENNYDEAIKNYQLALESDQNYFEAHYWIGRCYFESNKLDKAIESFNNFISLEKDFKDAYYWVGLSYYKKFDYQSAINVYEIAISKGVPPARYYCMISYCCIKNNKINKAITSAKKAILLDNKFSESYICLGIAYNLIFSYELAIENFNKALEIEFNEARAYLGLGMAYFGLNQITESKKHFLQAKLIDPDFTEYIDKILEKIP
ncbi:MAG: tetratricopeptide repeat protein [Cyanobacteriota bacterium]